MKTQTQPYEQWIEELKTVAKAEFGFTDNGLSRTDWNAYRLYYDDGCTPREALAEDFSNA